MDLLGFCLPYCKYQMLFTILDSRLCSLFSILKTGFGLVTCARWTSCLFWNDSQSTKGLFSLPHRIVHVRMKRKRPLLETFEDYYNGQNHVWGMLKDCECQRYGCFCAMPFPNSKTCCNTAWLVANRLTTGYAR